MSAIRVVVVEPQQMYRQGLLRDLEDARDIEVIAAGATGHDALTLIPEHNPDVTIMGIQLVDISGLVVLEELDTERHKVLILTQEEDPTIIIEAMLKGARGYILKWFPMPIDTAVRRIHSGGRIVDDYALDLFIEETRRLVAPVETDRLKLTVRERQILGLVARGFTQPRVAEVLHLGQGTIKSHCRSIYRKLDVHSQAAAVAAAQRLGYI